MRIVFVLLAASFWVGASAASPAAEEELVVDRERVLASDGVVVEIEEPRRLDVRKGNGKVAEMDFQQQGARAFQLHFRMAAAAVSGWTLQILDRDGREVWRYSPAPGKSGDVWSNEVPGSSAKLIVTSSGENDAFTILIDRAAVSDQGTVPESVSGARQFEAIDRQSPEIREIGRATARLRFIGDNGRRYVCTGFLISPDLFVTNWHCPKSAAEWDSSLIDFDYNSDLATPETLRFSERIGTDRNLDVAIYRLERKLDGRQPLKLMAAELDEDLSLFIIQHPGGEPKQISRMDCRVKGADLAGVSSRKTDFGHLCDTLGGSSGSAVMSADSKQIVGLHHLGFVNRSRRPVNRAVKASLILEWIAEKHPALKAELGL